MPDIRALLDAPRETLSVEHKQWLDLSVQHDRGVLAKALIALANHGGGHVLIGVAETQGGVLRSIVKRPEGIGAYTQELIANVVRRFIDPVFDCELEHILDNETGFEVAVVSVSAGVPDIVLSKSGIPDGPITEFRAYVRKPGPASEVPTTIAEWRALFDRCVKARQSEMLDAIRSIVQGTPTEMEGLVRDDLAAHRDFIENSRRRWKQKLEITPTNSAARMPLGYWEFSVSFTGNFDQPSLRQLDEWLKEAERVKHSGWPPFLYMHRPPFTPLPIDGGIESWIYEQGREDDPAHCDFWRWTQDGRGYMVRGYQEDAFDRVLPGTAFDITTPTWRIGETLLSIGRVAALFAASGAEVTVRYTGLSGRSLVSFGNPNRWISRDRTIQQEEYEKSLSINPRTVENELPELVFSILSPLYELFGFFDLPHQLVVEELASMRRNRF